MKKIIFLVFLFLFIFIIYSVTNTKKDLFFTIGNKKGNYFYDKEDMHISEIEMSIQQNEEIDNKNIQQILIKSSRIQIDCNSLFRLSSYNRLLTQIDDLEELLILIRKYCKEKIEIVLIKEKNDLAEYANKKISILCKKYDIIITR